jgi:CRP-like cAMP-binding protein
MNPKNANETRGTRMTLSELIDKLTNLATQEENPEVEFMELKASQVLFEQGQEGEHAYLLVAGVLDVKVRQPNGTETKIDRAAPGDIIGEIALMSGDPRSATVYAVNDAALIRLSRSKFEQLTAEETDVLIDNKVETDRIQRLQIMKIMGEIAGEFDASRLHHLQSEFEWLVLAEGDEVFQQGDSPDGLYYLIEGILLVSSNNDGEGKRAGVIYPGEIFGEYSLLTGDARPANVTAGEHSKVVRIPKEVYEKLVEEVPEITHNLTWNIIRRQQQAMILAQL